MLARGHNGRPVHDSLAQPAECLLSLLLPSVVTANTKETKGTEPLRLLTVQLEEHAVLSGALVKSVAACGTRCGPCLQSPRHPKLTQPPPVAAPCALTPSRIPLDVCQRAYETAQHTSLEEVQLCN